MNMFRCSLAFPINQGVDIGKAWCVYHIVDVFSNKVVSVRSCPLWRVFKDGAEINLDGSLLITVIGVYQTPRVANSVLYAEIGKYRTMDISPAIRRHLPIQCIETGQIFPNLTAVVQSMGVTAAALSNHLNGVPSYKRVKGYTFHRVQHT